MPSLRVLSSFRDAVRQAAMTKSDSALKDILALCDKLRDNDLVPLGVALDDQESEWSDVNLDDTVADGITTLQMDKPSSSSSLPLTSSRHEMRSVPLRKRKSQRRLHK
jgi:hypothetical protein